MYIYRGSNFTYWAVSAVRARANSTDTSLRTPARLVLKDGTVFNGYSFGAAQNVSGELVFNTGMTSYPESLTDPSYRGQILTSTYPLVGNYGVPAYELDEYGLLRHFESNRVQVRVIQ